VRKTGPSQNEYFAVLFAVMVGEALIMERIKIVYMRGKITLHAFYLPRRIIKHLFTAQVFQKGRNDFKIMGV
jgi:hypothetical protein